jgi:hypothetical protein
MAKPVLAIPEPDSLLTAPTRPRQDDNGQKPQFLISRVHTKMTLGDGTAVDMANNTQGVVGFCPVFDDYEKALAFTNGDPSVILTVCKA